MYPGFSATLLFIVAGALSMAVANRSRPPLLACCVGVAAWATSLVLSLQPLHLGPVQACCCHNRERPCTHARA